MEVCPRWCEYEKWRVQVCSIPAADLYSLKCVWVSGWRPFWQPLYRCFPLTCIPQKLSVWETEKLREKKSLFCLLSSRLIYRMGGLLYVSTYGFMTSLHDLLYLDYTRLITRHTPPDCSGLLDQFEGKKNLNADKFFTMKLSSCQDQSVADF